MLNSELYMRIFFYQGTDDKNLIGDKSKVNISVCAYTRHSKHI